MAKSRGGTRDSLPGTDRPRPGRLRRGLAVGLPWLGKLGSLIGFLGGVAGLYSFQETRKERVRNTQIEIQRLIDKSKDQLGGEEGAGRLTAPRRVSPAQLVRARRFLSEALTLAPNDPEVVAGYCMLLTTEGKYREAEAVCRERLRLEPDSCFAHGALASTLLVQKRNKEGLAHAQRGVSLCPRDVELHCVLSNCLQGLKRYDEALAAAQTAVKLNKESATAQGQLADVLIDMKRYAEAELPLRMAVRLDPKSARDWGELGATLAAQGKPRESVEAFAVAVAIDPQPPPYVETVFTLLGLLVVADPPKTEHAEATLREAIADRRTAPYAFLPYCL